MSSLPSVDKYSPVPLYHQVASVLEEAINDGRYAPGQLIEGEHELSRRLGVSRLTLRKAVDGLVSRGLLVRERGIGTRVVLPKVTRNLVARLTGLQEDLTRDGVKPSTEVIRFEDVPCPASLATHFDTTVGSPVLFLERLRSVGGRPIALMRNHFPQGLFQATASELADNSLYQIMRERGVEPRAANQTICAQRANVEDAELLHIDPNDPILVLERVSYNASGDCIEHSRTQYAADRYSFEMRLIA